jgi:hypothetical protein
LEPFDTQKDFYQDRLGTNTGKVEKEMRFLAKVWAIIGMPVGFVSISVLGFMLRSPPPVGANLNPEYLYFAVSVALLVRE